jgi:murein DD-endopeptidase MepM/ murein hydrolase activator NlpD
MKKVLLFLAFFVAFTVLFRPTSSEAASELSNIKKQIAELKHNLNQTQNTKKKIAEDRQSAAHEKNVTAQSINSIMGEIDNVSRRIQTVSSQMDATEAALLEAGKSLEETEARIESRDKLLQSRVRLMYTNGFVSYMDVLLSSTDFTDFLDRFDALQSIMSQDKDILEQHKLDKQIIVTKKAEIEHKFAEVETLYGKVQSYHVQLVEKEKKKENVIQSLNQKIESLNHEESDLEDISEEQEALLIKLAKKQADLIEKSKKKKATRYYTGGKLGMPMRDYARMSSNFGTRTDPFTGRKKSHNGIDFAAPKGTDIFAAESGTVIVAQEWSGFGNCVVINHGGGLWTIYGHIRVGGIKVKNGQSVKRGQKIAEVGSTGRSTGNHLHFEVRLNEKPVNPVNYLK